MSFSAIFEVFLMATLLNRTVMWHLTNHNTWYIKYN